MLSPTLKVLLKNNIFRKTYLLIILLFTSLLFSAIFGDSLYLLYTNVSEHKKIEGLTTYGGVSIPDSRSAVEDILNSNNSSIVKIANIKNVLLDTKVGTKDNLAKSDLLYYDQVKQLFTEVNDSTISSDKQLSNIQEIMKQVNPALRIPDNKPEK